MRRSFVGGLLILLVVASRRARVVCSGRWRTGRECWTNTGMTRSVGLGARTARFALQRRAWDKHSPPAGRVPASDRRSVRQMALRVRLAGRADRRGEPTTLGEPTQSVRSRSDRLWRRPRRRMVRTPQPTRCRPARLSLGSDRRQGDRRSARPSDLLASVLPWRRAPVLTGQFPTPNATPLPTPQRTSRITRDPARTPGTHPRSSPTPITAA